MFQFNRNCQHCTWIQGDYSKAPKRIPRLKQPIYICKPDNLTSGASVFNSSNRFYYTFNVVHGVKNDWRQHSNSALQSLLICATRFIEYLNKTYQFKHVRLLVNSQVKKDGEKEHIHAMITMDSKEDEKKYVDVFGYGTPQESITNKPYNGDIVFDITTEEGYNMIRDKATSIVAEKLNVERRELANIDFFLFLRYDADRGTVSGELSTPA